MISLLLLLFPWLLSLTPFLFPLFFSLISFSYQTLEDSSPQTWHIFCCCWYYHFLVHVLDVFVVQLSFRHFPHLFAFVKFPLMLFSARRPRWNRRYRVLSIYEKGLMVVAAYLGFGQARVIRFTTRFFQLRSFGGMDRYTRSRGYYLFF